jgi:hypothetical protein
MKVNFLKLVGCAWTCMQDYSLPLSPPFLRFLENPSCQLTCLNDHTLAKHNKVLKGQKVIPKRLPELEVRNRKKGFFVEIFG